MIKLVNQLIRQAADLHPARDAIVYGDKRISYAELVQQSTAGHFKQDPLDTFRKHVWISPFGEDNLEHVVELMGADHVVFGSDWPHIEGQVEPLDYVSEIGPFSAEDQRKIMGENARQLNERRPL